MATTTATVARPSGEPAMRHATTLPTLVPCSGCEGRLGGRTCAFACQPHTQTEKLRRTSQNRKQRPQCASAGSVSSRLLANALPNPLGRASAKPSQASPELSSTHVVDSEG